MSEEAWFRYESRYYPYMKSNEMCDLDLDLDSKRKRSFLP